MAKVVSVIAKIVIARKISVEAMSIYSLTLPTLSLLLNIAQLGIPTTISKLIAKRKHSIFKIMQVSIFILLILDLIIGIIYILFVPSIANQYLKNSLTILTLYGMVLLLPLISLTSLLKGYYIGIDRVDQTSKCQISEELARLLFVIFFVDLISKDNISLLAFFAMFSTIVGEIASLIHLILKLNIKSKRVRKRIKVNNQENQIISKNILKYSLMSTSTKLIGSIIYFFEPIIFTSLMLKSNVSLKQLTLEYGIVNSYVFPLLLLPSFFANCISIYMLPKLSKHISTNNYKSAKNLFIGISFLSFSLGFICILLVSIYPDFFTNLLYGKVIGSNYIKKYGIWICVCFISFPMHMALIAFDKEKNILFESIIGNVIRISLFFILIPTYHTDGMILAILISTYISFFIQSISLLRCFITFANKSKRIINL